MIRLSDGMVVNTIIEPGIYSGMGMDVYLEDCCPEPSLSRSIIKSLIYECPKKAYFKHPKFNPNAIDHSNGGMDLGSAVHSLLLEGIDIAACINPEDYPGQKGEIPKGWTTKAIKEARDAARANGKIPMLPDDYQKAVSIAQAASEQLADSEVGIQSLQAEGWSETVCAWQEKGIWLRTRNDWLSSDYSLILDLKTTSQSAEPGSYVRQILASGGDIQAALYTRGIKKLTGVKPRFVLMVVEIEPPYLCSFISLSPTFMELGKQKVEEGMRLWSECLSSGVWGGYPNRIMQVDAPPWAVAQYEERKFTTQLLQQEANSEDDFPF